MLSGLAGVLVPGQVAEALHLPALSGRGNAEVRAGLGGTYLALGGWALFSRKPEARTAVGVTWLGAAGARLTALAVDRPETDFTYWSYLALEVAWRQWRPGGLAYSGRAVSNVHQGHVVDQTPQNRRPGPIHQPGHHSTAVPDLGLPSRIQLNMSGLPWHLATVQQPTHPHSGTARFAGEPERRQLGVDGLEIVNLWLTHDESSPYDESSPTRRPDRGHQEGALRRSRTAFRRGPRRGSPRRRG